MLNKGELTGLPGIFLVYEFNPFMVEKVEKVIPLSHFVTQVPLGLAAIQNFYVIYLRTLIKSSNIQRLTKFCIVQPVAEAYPCVIHPFIQSWKSAWLRESWREFHDRYVRSLAESLQLPVWWMTSSIKEWGRSPGRANETTVARETIAAVMYPPVGRSRLGDLRFSIWFFQLMISVINPEHLKS